MENQIIATSSKISRISGARAVLDCLKSVRTSGFPTDFATPQDRQLAESRRPVIEHAIGMMEEAIVPATEPQALFHIELLERRYHTRESLGANEKILKALDEQWIEDLSQYPDWLIAEACRAWRNNPKSSGFAPRDAGQLMGRNPKILVAFHRIEHGLVKAKKILQLLDGE